MSKCVVKVDEKSRDEIQDLFEKIGALENLVKIVNPEENMIMYQQIVKDYSMSKRLFKEWWNILRKNYNLDDGNYYINFETCEIFRQDE